ncbi:MAG: AAA family ATPase [Clostridiales bacterium]|nr:AAA family ATPase [Clostridiales bacterium]
MSYFNEIADYATYSGHEADFHFTYNANSGGGQAFLGGRFYDENGQLTSPETLNGKTAVFKYIFRSENGEEHSVIIDDEKAKYEIKPRGNGSTSMKLGIGTDRIAPSKIVSSFMMLPPTCGVKTPSNLQLSILSANNYWLQSMWLECSTGVGTENEAVFTVKDCVFGGGVSKETTDRTGRYFKLNIEKRMADIIALSQNTDIFGEGINRVIKLFSDIYLGLRAFNYEECTEATKSLMELLAQQFPDVYSGITDPVSVLLDISVRKRCGDTDNAIILTDNESAFKDWLSLLPKANGEPYSENTRNQYVGALKAVATQFVGAIKPFTSVFEIADVEIFERAVAAIKADGTYEEFNRNRGNGSLSAGLDLYKRFLLERDNTSNMFSPEWFRKKAAEYPTLDKEASQLLADFQAKFSPDYLASLSGVEMLNTIFLNAANSENVCRVLEFGPQIKDTFGSIKGGNAYKYGLYYSTQGAWMTGSHQKPRQLTEEEAIEVGTKLRDHLVSGANAIKEYGPLATLEDYKKLHQILHEVTEGDIERVWFLKYYQMLYPELFATNYSDYAQRTVLGAIGEEKEKYPFVRMGQIRFYANKCGISNVMFNKIFWDYYSEEATTAKNEPAQDICYNTGYHSEFPRNRILFGAPGTGKSFTLNHEKDALLADGGEYERVTFHPDYSYANFVGTYKPVPCKDSDGKDAITYSYVPGPFMRTYVKALQNSRTDAPKPFLLVIEEINRANVAAVFGDVFQLLDRGDDEISEYPIQASEDIKKYLAGELGGNPDDYSEIRIPDNMFIWATMNSADQGVFPMDTAFKRRWDFTYLGIDDSEAGIVGKKVILGQGEYRRIVEWNDLRKAINSELLTYRVNEDKLMGPYFISKKNLPEGDIIDPAVFTRIFKNKVIMYLFDDAAKQKRSTLFGGCDEKAKNQYSKICREFDTRGVYIFCEAISSQFIDNVPEDDGE